MIPCAIIEKIYEFLTDLPYLFICQTELWAVNEILDGLNLCGKERPFIHIVINESEAVEQGSIVEVTRFSLVEWDICYGAEDSKEILLHILAIL